MQFGHIGKGWLAAIAALCICASVAAWAQEGADPAPASDAEAGDDALDAILEYAAPDSTGDASSGTAPGPEADETTSRENETTEQAATADDTTPVLEDESPAPVVERSAAVKAARTVGIEEIIVTATKREASVREIPATISVVSGEELEARGARDLQDFLKLIPGITLQEGETDTNRTISIRGIGPQPNANVTTGVLFENVSMTDPFASYLVPDLDPFDLHNLEVLKGPQGTLFGANALNGAIRYVFNKPQLGVWEGKAFVSRTDVDEGGMNKSTRGAAVNVPLGGDKAAVRLVGVKQDIPGLYDDVNANGKNQKDADAGEKEMHRVLAYWQPTDALKVNAFYLEQDAFRGDLSIANNLDGEFVRTITPGPSTSEQKFEVGNIAVNYDLGWSSVVLETSSSKKFSDINYDASSILPALAELGIETLRLHATLDDTNIRAHELRLVSPGDGPWNWVGGIYLYRYEAQFSLNAPIANTAFLVDVVDALGFLHLPVVDDLRLLLVPTPDGLSLQNVMLGPIKAQEESVFGEVSRKFFEDRLEVTLGGRKYREKMSTTARVNGLLGPFAALIGFTEPRKLNAKGFNPKVSLKYHWTPDFMLYGTVARGFQFGGINGPAPIPTDNVYPPTYDPSRILSKEIGIRTGWFDNTLQFDLAAFDIDWTDMQLTQGTPSGNTDYVDNLSKARSKGLESTLVWLTPIPGLVFSNAAAYIKATVEEAYTTAEGDVIPPGTELPASPRLKTTTSLAYTIPFGSFNLGANLSYSQTDEAFSNILHDFEIFDFKSWDAGLKLGFRYKNLAPELSLSISNLTNETGLLGARFIGFEGVSRDEVASFVRPRTAILRFNLEF